MKSDYRIYLNEFKNDICRQIHSLCSNMLIRAVVSMSACSQVRAGQSLKAELGAVCTAPDWKNQGCDTCIFAGFFGMVYEVPAAVYNLGHIAVLLGDCQSDRMGAPLLIHKLFDMAQCLLTHLKEAASWSRTIYWSLACPTSPDMLTR